MSARRRKDEFNPQDVGRLLQAFGGLDRRAQVAIVAVLVVIGIIAAFVYVGQHRNKPTSTNDPSQTQPTTRHDQTRPTGPTRTGPRTRPTTAALVGVDLGDPLLLGNPSRATPDPADRDNYLLVRPPYALSWSDRDGTPNWVSWRTVASNFGNGQRQPEFMPDPDLPPGFKRVVHRDYSNSGFDRGHVCPNADRDLSTELAAFTFYTTNVMPQSANLNQKAWANLEIYARNLASRRQQRLYTVAGRLGRGGEGLNGRKETIGPGGAVAVPAHCWKVIVAIPDPGGSDDPQAITTDARVIAVVMPNDQSVGEVWAGYRTTPADIEGRTGYKFFDRLRPDVAEVLRQKVDAEYVEPPKPYRGGGEPR